MKITITTTIGNIRVELFSDKAPITVANFVHYLKNGFYSNTVFHRIVPGFIIQAGGVDITGEAKTDRSDPIASEASNGLHNERYTLAMARLSDDPDSATCEFFINLADNLDLDYHAVLEPGFTVFGKVISGFDVIDKIASMPTHEYGIYPTYPVNPVMIIDMAFSTDPVVQPKQSAAPKPVAKVTPQAKPKPVPPPAPQAKPEPKAEPVPKPKAVPKPIPKPDPMPEMTASDLRHNEVAASDLRRNEVAAKEEGPATPIIERKPVMQNDTQENKVVTEESFTENPQVKLNIHVDKKEVGDIVIELFPEDAPKTVANFLAYVRDDFYEGTIFHRVIDGFMIQGGGYNQSLVSRKRKDEIKFEGDNGLSNISYSVAMARGQTLDSASSEFYINVADNIALDHEQRKFDSGGYCVFGHVVDGFEIVDMIAKLDVEPKSFHEHVPTQTVMIMKTAIAGEEKPEADKATDAPDAS